MASTDLKLALKNYIRQFISLSEDDFELAYQTFQHRRLKKKDHLIQTGEYCDKMIFTANGYFRFYHWDDQGNEITSDFLFCTFLYYFLH